MVEKYNIKDFDIYPCKYVHLNNVKPIFVARNDSSSNFECFIHSASDGIIMQNISTVGHRVEDKFYRLHARINALCQIDENNILFATASKNPEFIQWNYHSKEIIERVNIPFTVLRLYATQHFDTVVAIYQKELIDNGIREKCAAMIKLEDNGKNIALDPIINFKDIPLKCVTFCKLTGHFVAVTKKNCITIVNVYNFAVMNHCHQKLTVGSTSNMITCIEISWDGVYISIGTNNGMIYVYDTESLQLINRLHWHCRAIEGLYFDMQSNNYLNSIGHEGTMVQWEISTKLPRFVPRITLFSFKYIIGATNRLLLIDQQNEIIHIDSRSVTVCYRSNFYGNYKNLIGLKYCPTNQCFVTNGRWGTIDFYSPSVNKIIYSLTVIKRNIVTINKTVEINVTDITFMHNGHLMITIEQPLKSDEIIDYKNMSDYIKIKWWRFDSFKQRYKIHQTQIHPHLSFITSLTNNNVHLAISDNSNDNNIRKSMLITTSFDLTIKIWSCSQSQNSWNCISTLSYKKCVPNNCVLSQNSDYLAVSMSNCVVLWDIDSSHSFIIRNVIPFDQPTMITFGNYESSHILCIVSNKSKFGSFYNIANEEFISTFVDKNVYAILPDTNSGNVCLITSDDGENNRFNIEVYGLSFIDNNTTDEIEFTIEESISNNETKLVNKPYIITNVRSPTLQSLCVMKNILRLSRRKVGPTYNTTVDSKSLCFMNNPNEFIPIISNDLTPPLQLLSQPLYILSSNNSLFCLSNKMYIDNLKTTIREYEHIHDIETKTLNVNVVNMHNPYKIDATKSDEMGKSKHINFQHDLLECKKKHEQFSNDMSSLASHTLSNPNKLLKKLLDISVITAPKCYLEMNNSTRDDSGKIDINQLIESSALCENLLITQNDDNAPVDPLNRNKSHQIFFKRKDLGFITNLQI